MLLTNLIIGALIGIAMSVPVGPAGVIGVKRIIARGYMAGIASGLGVALGDLLFASVAMAGLAQVTEFLLQYAQLLQLSGAIIIIFLSLHSLKKGPQLNTDLRNNRPLDFAKDFSSMLAITLANPQTVIGFSTSFAATVALYTVDTNEQIMWLVGGVFLGSLSMWCFLSWLVNYWRGVMADDLIHRLHRYASVFVFFIGFALLLHALLLGDSAKLV